MNHGSSSTSGFETPAARLPGARVGLWLLAWLTLFDVGIGLVFPTPRDPRREPRGLAHYFSYGLSVESKLRIMVQAEDARSAWIVPEGWIDNPPQEPGPARDPDPSTTLIAAYGQSFTKQLVNALPSVDPGFVVRLIQAPAAPLNHSFKAYTHDRAQHHARVVVIGILSSTLSDLVTMTAMTRDFEFPYPYTYPRYLLQQGQLIEVAPSLRSLADLRAALADPDRWRTFRDDLVAHDLAFSSFVFDQDVLDRSVLGRLVRRAVAQHHQRIFQERFHHPDGFVNTDGLLDVAEAILVEFSRTARQDGRLPYVVLFNDLGYSDHLTTALGPRLRRRGIAFLSSHEDAPPDDPNSFGPDNHIRPDLNLLMATRWAKDLRSRLAAREAKVDQAKVDRQ